MTSKEQKVNDFTASPEPLPYLLRNGEFGVVTKEGPHGGYEGFLLPSEIKSAWDKMGCDIDGDAKYDLMEVVRPGSPMASRFKVTIERLSNPKQPELKR